MDIETTGYIIEAGEEAVERYQLEEHGYRLSETVTIDGETRGFVAIRYDRYLPDGKWRVYDAALVIIERDA